MSTPQDLFRRLIQINRELKRRFDEEARAVGLTLSRARVLTLVARHPGATQTELARLLEVEAPTMKRLIDGLEAGGFVERRLIPGDRRANAVWMTDRACANLGGLLGFVDRLPDELAGHIDPQDLEAALRVVERIAERLRATAPACPGDPPAGPQAP